MKIYLVLLLVSFLLLSASPAMAEDETNEESACSTSSIEPDCSFADVTASSGWSRCTCSSAYGSCTAQCPPGKTPVCFKYPPAAPKKLLVSVPLMTKNSAASPHATKRPVAGQNVSSPAPARVGISRHSFCFA